MKRLRLDHAVILGAIIYVAILAATAPAIGFVRDEGYYFKAAEEYSAFFGALFSKNFLSAFDDGNIQRWFGYNTEHPALIKLLQGATYHIFHRWLGVASPAQGFRIAGFIFAGLSVIATYMLGKRIVSPRAGVLAALLLASTPRYFFDAHLACFDVPMTAMWTFALVAYWDALTAPPETARKKAWISALFWGLAIATKLNGLFLPVVYVAVWFVSPVLFRFPRVVRGPSGSFDVALPAIPRVLVYSVILGPIIFILSWPYLWHDTFTRIGAYIAFHLNHEHYPISYFHELLVKPPFPWSFPVVMTIVTAPGPIVFLGSLGFMTSVARVFRRRSVGDAILVMSVFLPIFLIALPSTPIFGGVKHWYNAMPGLAIFAARSAFDGIDLLAKLSKVITPRVAAAACSVVMLLPGVLGCAFTHPNGIGYYNELAGGYRGGAELGMQRGFWGTLAFPLYRSLNDLPVGSRVFFNRTNYDSYRMYVREGLFPGSISYANDPKGGGVAAAFDFSQAEHAERAGEIWSNQGTRPVAGVYQDNVELIQMYRTGPSGVPPQF